MIDHYLKEKETKMIFIQSKSNFCLRLEASGYDEK